MRRDCEVMSLRHCERSEAIHLTEQRKNGLLRFARNDGVKRDRGVMHDKLPSLHAPLRVAGSEASKARSRGRGWGVYQLASLAASLLRHPPPPTPKSELRSSRPHRFAGGGEQRR